MLAAALGIGLQAFIIGFSGAMAPGPVLTVTITETILRGRRSAIMLMVGHALLEIVLIAAFVAGLRYVLADQLVVRAISVGGGIFLVWMGANLLRQVVTGEARLDLRAAGERPRHGPVLDGVATSLSNPYFIIWWATIGATLVLKALALGPVALAAFYIGHEGADFAWYGAVIAAVSGGRRFITQRAYAWVLGALAAAVLALGLYYLADTAVYLLR